MRINRDKLWFAIKSLRINCRLRRHIESVTEKSGYPERGERLKEIVANYVLRLCQFGISLRRTPREINWTIKELYC